ncbi:hypothetical protein CMO92_04235 [Candidatus Woesearchaeota archaeon]|nr:hypothetical protein [Candidatus Woesearchaeota archaeon]|tara:strand:+ start:508 stop:762 length:255 start_codon:yes stop_codon:yes gene_type:complete
MYALTFDPKAISFLDKLPLSIKHRIFTKIEEAQTSPFHYFERLTQINSFKLRIGEYRVIADISQKEKTISVQLIGHRKNVYQKL